MQHIKNLKKSSNAFTFYTSNNNSMNRFLVITCWTTTILLSIAVQSTEADYTSDCCYSKVFSSSTPKCGDGSKVRGFYCGYGSCNLFGCYCKGGCRNSDHSMMRFRSGDIIVCEMTGFLVSVHRHMTRQTLFHVMLAVNERDVIHIDVDEDSNGEIKRETFTSARNGKIHCHVETKYFDKEARDFWGVMPYPSDIAVKRALAYETVNSGRKIEYDVFVRNCEDWVTFWKYGFGFNLQSDIGGQSRLAKFLGLKPKVIKDDFEGQYRITWDGSILPDHQVYEPTFKPIFRGICWRNADCYSRSCDLSVGQDFGYCDTLTLASIWKHLE